MKVKQPVTHRRTDLQDPGLREVDKKPPQQEVKEAREVEEVKKPKRRGDGPFRVRRFSLKQRGKRKMEGS